MLLLQLKKTFKKNTMKHLAAATISMKTVISVSPGIFHAGPGEEQLRDDMDTALKAMKEDGTLTKLSIEYTGSDYNSEE